MITVQQTRPHTLDGPRCGNRGVDLVPTGHLHDVHSSYRRLVSDPHVVYGVKVHGLLGLEEIDEELRRRAGQGEAA